MTGVPAPRNNANVTGPSLGFFTVPPCRVVDTRVSGGPLVAGVDLAGLNPSAAAAKLTQGFAYPQTGRIYLQDGDLAWKASPAELGLFLDPEASASIAYQKGREGNLFENLSTQLANANSPIDIAPYPGPRSAPGL